MTGELNPSTLKNALLCWNEQIQIESQSVYIMKWDCGIHLHSASLAHTDEKTDPKDSTPWLGIIAWGDPPAK